MKDSLDLQKMEEQFLKLLFGKNLMSDKVRITVTLEREQWEKISNINGLGSTKTERIKAIITSWLNEKS